MRSVLGRELSGVEDWKLLCFERMRILDLAHSWALSTHEGYQSRLRYLHRFERFFGVSILQASSLQKPPSGPEIALMWAEEQYSLRLTTDTKRNPDGGTRVTYNTIRHLRSAVSQFLSWDMMLHHSGGVYFDHQRRLLVQPGRFTDDAGATFFAAGLSSRIGTATKPSVALLARHVHWIDLDLTTRYKAAQWRALKSDLARAGVANLILWLGWLRAGETLNLQWDDLCVIPPQHGPTADLPPGVGAVTISLLPETKSNRTQTRDVVIAYQTLSGLCLGNWIDRLRCCVGLGTNWEGERRPIFVHSTGQPWTSSHFRAHYLYPALNQQLLEGDAFLRAFDGSPGNSVENKFWSLHCYRRGGRTHVSRTHKNTHRKATDVQVYEHGRWRHRRSGEKIDVVYREWTLADRVRLTLLCM